MILELTKSYLVLAMLFVHPEHRRRGAARQLIDWGTHSYPPKHTLIPHRTTHHLLTILNPIISYHPLPPSLLTPNTNLPPTQPGIKEADRLNLETFIEATDDGKPCYEASGFVYMGTNYWEAAKRNPSERWKELERYFQTPIHTYLMWRPVGGRFVEGKTVVPWVE